MNAKLLCDPMWSQHMWSRSQLDPRSDNKKKYDALPKT